MPAGLPRFLVLLLLGALPSVSLLSAGEQRVAVVDMEGVFNGCNATKEAAAKNEEREKAASAELEARTATLKKLVSGIELLKSKESQGTGNGAKELQSKIAEARMMDREIADFRAARQKELQESVLRLRRGVLAEISKAIASVARSKGIDLVLDKSSSGPGSLPFVTYAREELDLTREVLEAVNAPVARPQAQGNP